MRLLSRVFLGGSTLEIRLVSEHIIFYILCLTHKNMSSSWSSKSSLACHREPFC